MGLATSASLFVPEGVAVDGAGNLYIADSHNNRIRKVSAATGLITTVAGNGTATFAGDGGAATAASLNLPAGVAVDGAGNLYIADTSNNRIREVSAATGYITTVAGSGMPTFAGDGGTATTASLNRPFSVSVDGSGNIYIADTQNNRVRVVMSGTGIITTVAGTGMPTFGGDGGPATSASLSGPDGVAVDAGGNVYIDDEYNSRIRKVTAATGNISTVAGNDSSTFSGDGAAATSASLYFPGGVAVDGAGNLYIGDESNARVRKVTVKGGISFPTATAAGTTDTTDGVQLLALDNVGNAALTITSQQNNNGSYVLSNPMTGGCSTAVSVAAGASCILGEQFHPVVGSNGVVSASLAITDNSLNVAKAVQLVPLYGTTSAGSITVTVSTSTANAGAATTTIGVLVQYGGTVADTGAITLTVNGSAAGVGTPSCTVKSGHKNCLYPYTGSALATPGVYPVVATVASDSNYAAGSGTTTLSIK